MAHLAQRHPGESAWTPCPPLLDRFPLMSSETRVMVNNNDHFSTAPSSLLTGSRRRRSRAHRDPPGPGHGAALHRRRALHRPRSRPGRAAPQALPGRAERGAGRRDGPGPHDDPQGLGRRPVAGRRQGRDDRRRPGRHARCPPHPGRRRDRRAGRRLHHRGGHRHHHRRHGPDVAAHPLRRGPLPGTRRTAATPPPSPPRRSSRPCAAVSPPPPAPTSRATGAWAWWGSARSATRWQHGWPKRAPTWWPATSTGRGRSAARPSTGSGWRRRPRRCWPCRSTWWLPAPPAA